MDSTLRAVLRGNPDDPKTPRRWSNGRASVEYRYSEDLWVWKTPEGTGSSDLYEKVYDAVKKYL